MRFDSYHPAVNLVFYVVVFVCTLLFDNPIYVGISFLSAWLNILMLRGKKAWIWNGIILGLAAVFWLIYMFNNHYGMTVLGVNFDGNSITLESVVGATLWSLRLAAVTMWFGCFLITATADKIIYMAGKISPRLSLYIAVALRVIPLGGMRWKKMSVARRGVTKSFGVFGRFSMLITWMTEHMAEMAESMRSRGYSLRGRTAYSMYRFDNRDRACVIGIFMCITIIWMAHIFQQTGMIYNPEIIWNRPTNMSVVFYGVYVIFCMIPIIVQGVSYIKYKRRGDHNEK